MATLLSNHYLRFKLLSSRCERSTTRLLLFPLLLNKEVFLSDPILIEFSFGDVVLLETQLVLYYFVILLLFIVERTGVEVEGGLLCLIISETDFVP
jgi:hypothetical protein